MNFRSPSLRDEHHRLSGTERKRKLDHATAARYAATMTKEYVKQRSNCPVERFANAILAMTALHDMNIEELKGESFCAYLLDVKARSQITRLTGPAPVMLGMPPSRNRG